MANALYDAGRNLFLTGGVNWTTGDINIYLVDAANYTPNLTSHATLSDVAGNSRIRTGALANKSSSAGVADADDHTFSTVAAGAAIEYILLAKSGATDAATQLIALIDTANGLPVTPGGGDITVSWDAGANKIFKL